ncbi:hypothetical protein HPB48_011591 [Haemaphysalis longicornis]|uniref:Uncharacterized protein n=1 Tax=Haemaphysalis longicornis TaxID=44386 RepID=A0A9J6GVT6_HAELO|nr:hypothetical protein HPB48_011591 [Haemaphysalis longicornis]
MRAQEENPQVRSYFPILSKKFQEKFLGIPKKNRRAFILMFCTSGPVKRRTGPDTTSHRGFCATYKVRLDNKKVVTVFRDMFCAVLGVSHSTVTRLLKHKHEIGEIKLENRGGHHIVKRYGAMPAAVVGFINRFRARESHYCRKKTKKLYLPSELKSIRNVWRIHPNFGASIDAQVTTAFFIKFFGLNLTFPSGHHGRTFVRYAWKMHTT